MKLSDHTKALGLSLCLLTPLLCFGADSSGVTSLTIRVTEPGTRHFIVLQDYHTKDTLVADSFYGEFRYEIKEPSKLTVIDDYYTIKSKVSSKTHFYSTAMPVYRNKNNAVQFFTEDSLVFSGNDKLESYNDLVLKAYYNNKDLHTSDIAKVRKARDIAYHSIKRIHASNGVEYLSLRFMGNVDYITRLHGIEDPLSDYIDSLCDVDFKDAFLAACAKEYLCIDYAVPIYTDSMLYNVLDIPDSAVDLDGLTIFHFWASWCKPCIAEMEKLKSFADTLPEVKIIMVSLDRNAEAWEKAISKFGIGDFVHYRMDEQQAGDVFGIYAIPTNLIDKPDDNVLTRIATVEGLRAEIRGIRGR